jgi:GDP-4-dehydro-6-deoxy-D-mannose reductase
LITGISGFAGRHLAQRLSNTTPDASLHGIVIRTPQPALPDAITLHQLDLRDEKATVEAFQEIAPTCVYHLAAQASVGRSFQAAWETLENNIRVQFNIIQACLSLKTPPRLLLVSSGNIYGAIDPASLPADESTPLRPDSPYSVSKATQDLLGLQYYLSHDLPVVRARPFNHFGPGQSEGFVTADFALQIARIEAGLQEARILVGDLETERDFTDVRDVVQAYQRIMEQGQIGDVYNIASGTPRSINALLQTLLSLTDADIEICPDPERMRPARIPIIYGSAAHLQAATGWTPTIPFEQSLLDTLNASRQMIKGPTRNTYAI